MISTKTLKDIMGLGYSVCVAPEINHAKITVTDMTTGICISQMLPMDNHVRDKIDECAVWCKGTLTEKLQNDKKGLDFTEAQLARIRAVFNKYWEGQDRYHLREFSRDSQNTYWVVMQDDTRIYMDVVFLLQDNIQLHNVRVRPHSLRKGKERSTEAVERTMGVSLDKIRGDLMALSFIQLIGDFWVQ